MITPLQINKTNLVKRLLGQSIPKEEELAIQKKLDSIQKIVVKKT